MYVSDFKRLPLGQNTFFFQLALLSEWKFSASILFESFQVDSLLILYIALINYSNTTADLWEDWARTEKKTLLTFLHTFEEARFNTRFIKQLYVILAALAGQLLKLLDQPFRLAEFSYWTLEFSGKIKLWLEPAPQGMRQCLRPPFQLTSPKQNLGWFQFFACV